MTKSNDERSQRPIAPEVDEYIAAVPSEQRSMFERLHNLVLDTLPDARVVISYKMPAYVVAGGRVSLSSGKRASASPRPSPSRSPPSRRSTSSSRPAR